MTYSNSIQTDVRDLTGSQESNLFMKLVRKAINQALSSGRVTLNNHKTPLTHLLHRDNLLDCTAVKIIDKYPRTIYSGTGKLANQKGNHLDHGKTIYWPKLRWHQ